MFIMDVTLQSLQSNNILTNKQFGFISRSSITLQLLRIMYEWTEIPEMGELVDVVYFDFQGAFNTVSHRVLIKIMTSTDRRLMLSWISDFLNS